MLPPSATICLIGFGEAGSCLAPELAARGCALRAYDPQLDSPATRAAMQQRIEAAGVHPALTLAEALRGSKLVICSVPEAVAGAVARSAAVLLQRGQIFLDFSAGPATSRRDHAALVEASGADYVEAVRIFGTEAPHLAMPMLLSGPRAAELAPALNALGFSTLAASDRVGFERGAAVPAAAAPPTDVFVRHLGGRGELP